MAQLQPVSFDELKPGSTVRVLMEQPPLIHAIDLAVVVTGEDAHDAAQSIRRIKTDVLDLRNKVFLRSIKLPSGTKNIKFVTYEDALKLVMALGGEPAKIMKIQFAKILTRFFAGDSTLVQEIQTNSTSTAPLNALARESESVGSKRVRDDNEADEERLQIVKSTKMALDEVVKVVDGLEPKLTQQKEAVVFMLPYVEKICEVQCNLENEKQKTYTIEGKTAEDKARIQAKSAEDMARIEAKSAEDKARIEAKSFEDMARIEAEQKERMAKLDAEYKEKHKQDLMEEREAELAFLMKKRQVLEGPLVLAAPAVQSPQLSPMAPIFLAPAEKRALKSIYGKLYTSRIDPVSFAIMAGHVRGCYQDKYNHKPEKSAGNDMYPVHTLRDVEGWIREWAERDDS